MLLNLSSDIPFVYLNEKKKFFDRKELESQLPLFFYENQDKIKEIFVINGPGYFSSTRVGVEIINILLALNIIENVYFLNKLDFFRQNNLVDIYLFSGNKNKFIYLQGDDYQIVSKKEIDYSKYFEELSQLKVETNHFLPYEELLKNYKNLNWEKVDNLLKPFYIFQPIL